MQFFATLLVGSLFTILASSSPLASKQAKGTNYLETYDEITVMAGTAPLNKAPSPLKKLDYSGVALQSSALGVASGFTPQSGTNTAFYSPLTDELDGGNAFIKVAKKGSTMTLRSFYFVCSTNAGAAIIPQDCTTIVSATAANGKAHSTTFKYVANGKKMQKVNFGIEMHNITSFGLVSTTGNPVDDGTLTGNLDNLAYTIYP